MSTQQLTYWKTLYPLSLIDRLVGSWPATEVVFHLKGGAVHRTSKTGNTNTHYASLDAMRDHFLEKLARQTLSLHIVPDPKRLIVFDLDIRDCYEKVPWLHGCRTAHSDKRVCAACWPMARIASRLLDVCIAQKLGLGPGLHVYSGGNGLHVWFRADPELQIASARKLVFTHLLSPSAIRADAALVRDMRALLPPGHATDDLEAFMPVLDVGVTIGVPRANDQGHAIKLPFSPHNSTRYLALPLVGTGATLAFPPLMTAEEAVGGSEAQRAAFRASKAAMDAWLQ